MPGEDILVSNDEKIKLQSYSGLIHWGSPCTGRECTERHRTWWWSSMVNHSSISDITSEDTKCSLTQKILLLSKSRASWSFSIILANKGRQQKLHRSAILYALFQHPRCSENPLVGGFGCGFLLCFVLGFVLFWSAFYKLGTNYAEWKPFIIFIPSVNINYRLLHKTYGE